MDYQYQDPQPNFCGDDVPVIWKWESEKEDYSDSDDDEQPENNEDRIAAITLDPSINRTASEESGTSMQREEEGDADENEEELSTASFKCLGAVKQEPHQAALERAREMILSRNKPAVKLVEEPDNRVDPNAVCFHVRLENGSWERIGYVAKELTEYVKRAMHEGDIRNLCVKWIRYRYWPGGCGFYAAISITRRGRWEHIVMQKSSL